MATDTSKEAPPNFFKVVRYPFAPYLVLPTAFVRMHLKKICENPILKTTRGQNSWRLKIKKIGENYCFSDGWEKLAKDAQLQIMDVVVVSLIDSFTLQVSFFDANGCEKDLPLNNTIFSGDDEVMADEALPDENLCFQKLISEKSNKYTMGLPKKFVEAAELKNKSGLTMKDHEGKEWIMGLMVEKGKRMSLSSGWSLFRQYHNLWEGDICLFKFIKKESVLILAQLLKSNRAKKQEFSCRKETPANVEGVKRKRGRPRLEKPHNGGGDGDGDGGVKVKIENESGPEAEVVKGKRGRPPLQKKNCGVGGGVAVKVEDLSGSKVEVVKRKRGRPRVEKHGSGGGGVKIEDGSGAAEVVKRKRGRPRVEKLGDDSVKIKIEDDDGSVVKRKRGRPPAIEKGGGVEVKTEAEVEVLPVKRKRGRPPIDRNNVVYF